MEQLLEEFNKKCLSFEVIVDFSIDGISDAKSFRYVKIDQPKEWELIHSLLLKHGDVGMGFQGLFYNEKRTHYQTAFVENIQALYSEIKDRLPVDIRSFLKENLFSGLKFSDVAISYPDNKFINEYVLENDPVYYQEREEMFIDIETKLDEVVNQIRDNLKNSYFETEYSDEQIEIKAKEVLHSLRGGIKKNPLGGYSFVEYLTAARVPYDYPLSKLKELITNYDSMYLSSLEGAATSAMYQIAYKTINEIDVRNQNK